MHSESHEDKCNHTDLFPIADITEYLCVHVYTCKTLDSSAKGYPNFTKLSQCLAVASNAMLG